MNTEITQLSVALTQPRGGQQVTDQTQPTRSSFAVYVFTILIKISEM